MEQLGDVAAETISVLLMKPLLIVPCLRHWAPTPLWGPGSVPNNWADVCVFLKPPGSQRFWEGTKHSAFSIPQNALETNDQTCLIYISSIGTTNGPNQAYYNGNISLKERPAGSTYGTQKTKISEVMSDHSLSS